MIEITYKDKKINTEEKTVYELLKNEIEENNIIACRFNNEVKSLNFELKEDGIIELIDISNKDGMRIYRRGLIYILNTFIFAIVALALSLLVSTLVNKKEAVSGIVNVVALSQAFLCCAFIPVMWLPDSVLKLAHVLPAYYYINSNELLASLEVLNLSNLKLIFINMGVMILFIVIFIILNNIFSKKKQVLR